MSSSVTDPKDTTTTAAENVASPNNKGKGKAPAADVSMEEEEEEEEDEEEDDEEEDEDEDEDEVRVQTRRDFSLYARREPLAEIDPSAILSGRRTRGVKVDYTSKEALAKAGLQGNDDKDDEDDGDVEMKD
ncbi:hypothetical protein H0H87_000982 [Tephrocybe sp. NHM501043]|nr:hypothetical protein H0H87_000982 [Tephrocybe sp. NHM501043]